MLHLWLLRHLLFCEVVLVHGDAEAAPEIGVSDDHCDGGCEGGLVRAVVGEEGSRSGDMHSCCG